jgi:hypothetical protein
MINKITNKNILCIVFIVIIVFVIIQRLNLYEGIMYIDGKYNTNTQKVVIDPYTRADYLHLSELVLYGDNGKIEYTASSALGNGIRDDTQGYDKLTDSDKNTFFHSKKENCILNITPNINSAKITKIVIRNRLDITTLDRLKNYKISIIRNDGSVFFSKNLNEVNNLYTYPYMEEILIS